MNALKGIIYNCRKATYLADKRMDSGLSFREHIELRIHLIRCDMCKRYIKQSEKIDQMIGDLLKTPLAAGIRLDDSFKTELQTQIDNQLNKN